MFKRTLSLLEQELANTISDSDRDALFEEMMEDPSIADELQHRERVLYDNLKSDVQNRVVGWPALASACMVFIGLTLSYFLINGSEDPSNGFASANVYELDNLRSASPEVSIVNLQRGERWVTFMAYPDFANFDSLNIRIESQMGDSSGESSEKVNEWRTVWSTASSVGNQDTLLISVRSAELEDGIHRLVVFGVNDKEATINPVHEVVFRIAFVD